MRACDMRYKVSLQTTCGMFSLHSTLTALGRYEGCCGVRLAFCTSVFSVVHKTHRQIVTCCNVLDQTHTRHRP